jgi:hypothetical protein
MAAVSLAPSVTYCFRGIFPNVAKFFQKDKLPHMNFFVYCPVFKGDERIVLPTTLTKDGWVWDAHETQEHRVLDPVEMALLGEVEIMNTNSSAILTTHPFDNPRNPREEVGPTSVRYKWIMEKRVRF